ncbi:hypothetical protein PGH46_00025 [Legionella pneumophila]|nr:hypothetical protein PGH46_00025 [Legionella pneumophila]
MRWMLLPATIINHFAAGHLRTPERIISHYHTNSPWWLLSNSIYMHNEENKYGIHVTNNLGEQWMVYGDYSYFNPFNQTNQQMLLKALQASS